MQFVHVDENGLCDYASAEAAVRSPSRLNICKDLFLFNKWHGYTEEEVVEVVAETIVLMARSSAIARSHYRKREREHKEAERKAGKGTSK